MSSASVKSIMLLSFTVPISARNVPLASNFLEEISSHSHSIVFLYIYYCGQESIRRNGVALRVNRRVQNAVLRCSLKNDRMISVCFQHKPFSITVIQVCALTSDAEEAEAERFYEDP